MSKCYEENTSPVHNVKCHLALTGKEKQYQERSLRNISEKKVI